MSTQTTQNEKIGQFVRSSINEINETFYDNARTFTMINSETEHTTELKTAEDLDTNTTFRLPPTNGPSGDALVTDGSGATSWGFPNSSRIFASQTTADAYLTGLADSDINNRIVFYWIGSAGGAVGAAIKYDATHIRHSPTGIDFAPL